MTNSNDVQRRDFVKIVLAFLGTIMGAVIGIPAIGYLLSPATKVQSKEAWIPAGPMENYPIGTPTLFSYTRSKINGWEKTTNSYGAYIVRINEADVKAFSNICTHLSCRVSWKNELTEYVCPCHDGHFDGEGKVTAGPPPAPLYPYETKVEEGVLYIHHVEG